MIALYDSRNAKPDPTDPNRLIGVVAYSARFYTRAEIERARADGRKVYALADRIPLDLAGASWGTLANSLGKLEAKRRRLQRDMARRRRRGERVHESWHSPEARQFLGRRHDPHGQHRHLAVIEVR